MTRISRIACIGLVFTTLGCGNAFDKNTMQAPASDFGNSVGAAYNSAASPQNPGYNCPSMPNVMPQTVGNEQNENATASATADQFTVCPSLTPGDYSDLLIHGQTVNSQSICIFPLNVDSGSGQVVPYLSAGIPVSACTSTTSTGAYVTIPSTTTNGGFNYVAIVEENEQILMQLCILKDFEDCPNYSYGPISSLSE